MTELPTVPVRLRVHLAHATLQAIAEECGADVLHIKGPAVDPSLRPASRSSVDADVLVRPAHLKRFLGALRRFGWQEVTRLTSGGLFEHSTNWYHGELGQVDAHIRFPGIQIEPDRAFECMWQERRTQTIARRKCTVPNVDAQRILMLLHAARNLESRSTDIRVAWTDASDKERDEVRALGRELEAEVALGAATGRLEEYRDHREYDLWRFYTDGVVAPRIVARAAAVSRAAPVGAKYRRTRVFRHILNVISSKPERLALQLGREPTGVEVIGAHGLTLRRVVNELWLQVRQRIRGCSSQGRPRKV